MDPLTLIILVIVCGIGILLAFRMITFVIRIISVAILLIAILSVAGSYFMAQAYVLPPANTAFIALTIDGGFVVEQQETGSYTIDATATAAFAREFIKPLNELNTSSYQKLKVFARGDFFASSDTVWVVNAITKSGCTQERILKEPKLFTTSCLDKTDTNATPNNQTTTSLSKIRSLVNVSALNRVPVKASFIQWLKNYYLN